MGTVAGVFTVSELYDWLIKVQGEYIGDGTAMGIGYIVAMLYALGVDSIIERRSAQVAILTGTILSALFGIYVHWLIGIIIGSVVGCISGAIIEHFTMKAVMAETILMVPGDAQPFKASHRTDGTAMYQSQGQLTMGPGGVPTLVQIPDRDNKLYDEYDGPDRRGISFEDSQRNQTLMLQNSPSKKSGKRFGFENHSAVVASTSGNAWMPASPSSQSPSNIAQGRGAPQHTGHPPGSRPQSRGPITVEEAFRMFDQDGSGEIDAKELRQALAALGMSANSNEIKSIMSCYDDNEDAGLQLEEFVKLVGDVKAFQSMEAQAQRDDEDSD